MKISSRAMLSTAVSVAAVLGTAVSASADTRVADPCSPPADDFTSTVCELVALNPGVLFSEMLETIEVVAASQGSTPADVASDTLVEARAHINRARAGANADKVVGPATAKGDVFYSPTSTLGVTHGHSGIYYSTTAIVEAPGPGAVVRNTNYANVLVASGSQIQHVSTTQANRDAAANLSNTFVGRAYNLNFALNKTANGNMNCSQVVWVAYKDSAGGIDLDSNGGNGVYPSDIRDSSYTSTYRTVA